ncbi:uncharacterized protein Dvar_77890 [Desulfosarcina variabilis str. Montpellier]
MRLPCRNVQGNRIWNFFSIFSECTDLPAVFESEKGGLRNPRSAFSNQPLGLFFLSRESAWNIINAVTLPGSQLEIDKLVQF